VNVYPFIEAEKSQRRNVKRACVLLKVSRSAFYADRTAAPSLREQVDAELTEAILAVHDESDGTYGAPRVHAELADQGRRHGRKRIARLMRAAGRRGRTPKRWRTTTVSDPTAALPADLIGRDFATVTAALNARWCGDITHIHTWEEWLYLTVTWNLAGRPDVTDRSERGLWLLGIWADRSKVSDRLAPSRPVLTLSCGQRAVGGEVAGPGPARSGVRVASCLG
jgi:hypothetical protein